MAAQTGPSDLCADGSAEEQRSPTYMSNPMTNVTLNVPGLIQSDPKPSLGLGTYALRQMSQKDHSHSEMMVRTFSSGNRRSIIYQSQPK